MPKAPPLILLADDEFAALEVLGLLLRAEGFEVITAADGQEALDIVLAQPVNLIITDYKMPRMDGLALCARLQQATEFSSIPVFMTSATYRVQRSLPAGVVAFIPKPIDFPALLTKIRHVLSGSGSGP